MKVINYCWSCSKQHDLNNTHFIGEIKNVKCECGGYVVTPSGKALFQIVKEGGKDEANTG
ncbi:hypothetical protein [Salibacterium aidingense]|uniref:hypothetical protein n=1 Tax=Salibacterium aidingense TaxID=384933 RepID=UPI0004793B0D|nr:hypothetical protein [Salibacterium aidingense]